MVNWLDIAAERERYNDYVRKAEYDQLVRQALARHATRERLTDRLLAWLGRMLIATGKHMQERYGDAARISRPLASLSR